MSTHHKAHFHESNLSENEKNRMYGHHPRHCRAVREDSAVVAVIARSTTGAQLEQFMNLSKLDFPLQYCNGHGICQILGFGVPDHRKYLIFHFCRCHSTKFFEFQIWNQKKTKYVWNSSRRDLFKSAIVYLWKKTFQKSFLRSRIGIFGIFSSGDVSHPSYGATT